MRRQLLCGPPLVLVAALALLFFSEPGLADPKNSAAVPATEFGVEGPMPRAGMNPGELPVFMDAVSHLGASFMVASFTPEWNTPLAQKRGNYIGTEGTESTFREFAALCRQRQLSFFINQQITSYCMPGDFPDKSGHDILAHGDGTHRWDIAGPLLEELSRMPEFRGVVYDEAEWGILRRDHNSNAGTGHASSGRIHPYFAVTENLNVFDAQEATLRGARQVATAYHKAGVRMMGEHVFPVMFHTFARAGMDCSTKFMKEGRDSVFAAVAMGAALQYDRDFCVSPDLWGIPAFGVSKNGFPGHPPEELRCSLLFAYWLGASRVLVENIYADFLGEAATGLLDRKVTDGRAGYIPSAYGKIYEWFVKEYVPAHPRPYTFRDCRPEMAIVRFDDSYWGQPGGYFRPNLYGGTDLAGPESVAWLGIWHLLTHGQTSKLGLSYHNRGWPDPRNHSFFTALNNVVVYDDQVSEARLAGLKVVFLTGLRVSRETQSAIAKLVRDEGLICISQRSLAPADVASAGDNGPIICGKGKWLLTGNFDTPAVAALTGPWLGAPDEIRYRFREFILSVKRGVADNHVTIFLQKDAQAPVQVW